MVGSIDKKQLNTIFWSPKGRFVVFANLGRGIAQFDFEIYDCDYEGDNKDINKELNANIMAVHVGESYGTTDVEWDPTGRYIATSSSFWKHPVLIYLILLTFSWKMDIKFVILKVPYSTNPTPKNLDFSHGVLVLQLLSPKTNKKRSAVISRIIVVNLRPKMKRKQLGQVRNYLL